VNGVEPAEPAASAASAARTGQPVPPAPPAPAEVSPTDLISDEDPDAESVGLFGASLILECLGGEVIEED